MRIGVDFHVMDGMHQGSRRYLYEIYKHLQAINTEHEICYFMGDISARPSDIGSASDYRSFGVKSSFARLLYAANSCARRENIDVMHYQYTGPFVPRRHEVITVHDILFESHPQYFPWAARMALGPMIRNSASRAAAICTVSEYSRQELANRYDIPHEKIYITPNGVDLNVFNPGDAALSTAHVLALHGVRDYILSVGRLEPRKNHIGLLRAYANLKQRKKEMPKLVFVGAKDFGTNEVMKNISKYKLNQDVVFIGAISDQELAHLYRAALCLAYPSYAEGFGLPPVEAMACGCPVLTSNTTALKEIVSNCGWMVDPDSQESIETELEDIIYSDGKRKEMVSAGLERIRSFSWFNSANVLLSVYDSLC